MFQSNDDKVIGVVVAKFHLYPPSIKSRIDNFAGIMSIGFAYTDDNGHEVGAWIGPALHDILDEFYKTTQAMIGEAISVSELKAFLAAKAKELK